MSRNLISEAFPILGDEEFTSWVKAGDFPLSMEHVGYETTALEPGVSSVIEAAHCPRRAICCKFPLARHKIWC